MKTPFLGPASQSRSRNLSYNRAVNIYPEIIETKDGNSVGAFYGTPGLTLLATVGTGPIRQVFDSNNGRLYIVSGNQLYSMNTAYASTLHGTIGTSTGPVAISENGGNQIQVVDGTGSWVWNYQNNVFTPVLPGQTGVVPNTVSYQDGLCLVNQQNSNRFYQSGVNDFTTYPAFSSADSTPDNIIALYQLRREAWIFKSDVTEIWVNQGLSGFSFQRLQGVQIGKGCVAPQSVARIGNTILWLGADEQGQGCVYIADGYNPKRISTHAIEYAIQNYSIISDAIAYTYQREGHEFYVLTFPTGNQTFVFDLATGMWHERASFSNGILGRHVSNCHALFNNLNVVGDYQNGNLYSLDLNNYTDNGQPIKRIRSWRSVPATEQSQIPIRFNELTVYAETGINIPVNTNPQYILRYSDDAGHTWSSERFVDGNKPGNTSSRITFRRLGQTKKNSGVDRIFELSTTDNVPIAWIGADLDAEPA